MVVQTKGRVLSNREIESGYFLLDIECEPIAGLAVPGQFVMIKASDDDHPLLRRPFSLYRSYPISHSEKKRGGQLSILYKRIGAGTLKMTEFKEEQAVDLIGPLGKGYTPPPLPSRRGSAGPVSVRQCRHDSRSGSSRLLTTSASLILIGGGIGIVSLAFLAERLKPANLFVFIGGKKSHDILCLEDFKKLHAHLFIATEDGSLGFNGTIIDLFFSQLERFKKSEPHYLYSCGPMEMLKRLARRIEPGRFVCQASLEARMACGFGACWGCVVKTTHPQTPYQRVCKEGPVFPLESIAWDAE